MIGAPLGSTPSPDAARVRDDWPAHGGAPLRAADPSRAERGTARLLRDLRAFGEPVPLRREPAEARLEALPSWLASLAYALTQQVWADGVAHGS
jgi:hypothetical protein